MRVEIVISKEYRTERAIFLVSRGIAALALGSFCGVPSKSPFCASCGEYVTNLETHKKEMHSARLDDRPEYVPSLVMNSAIRTYLKCKGNTQQAVEEITATLLHGSVAINLY